MSDSPPLKRQKLDISEEEYMILKKTLKTRKKKLTSIPRFSLNNVGELSSLTTDTVTEEDRIPIFLNDVQNLLLFSMLGPHSPYLPDRWCKLEKASKVSHTIVFIIEGLSIKHYVQNESFFEYLKLKFDHKLELITPASYGGSIINELAAVPLSETYKKHLIHEYGSLELAVSNNGNLINLLRTIFPIKKVSKSKNINKIKLPTSDKFSRIDLILSPIQLVEENYPIPIKGGLAKKYSDFILTKDIYEEVNLGSKMFSIDCEMCTTTAGVPELTRITIVDENYNVIYDTLVKPDNEITDYLTQYSGITKKMLQNVTTKLIDVQKKIINELPPDAILVGQSLSSDLNALKMMHPYIIDTSVIFNMSGVKYRKNKLKDLSREFLNIRIQEGKKGHCSKEDASAAMKLVKLKLKNSLDFGDEIMKQSLSRVDTYLNNGEDTHDLIQKQEHILSSPIFNYIVKIDSKTCAIYGCSDIMNEYSKIFVNSHLKLMVDNCYQEKDNVRLVISKSNKEAVERCTQVALEHALNFCHIKLNPEQLSEKNITKTLKSVDKWVEKIWNHTALNGLVCVIFGGEKNSINGACFLSIKKNIVDLLNEPI